jgi:predicted helicase
LGRLNVAIKPCPSIPGAGSYLSFVHLAILHDKFHMLKNSYVAEIQPLYARQPRVEAKLKADKEAGIIEINELMFLSGVPKEALEYKLGNRSALRWILDQYKEKNPSDPAIAEKFNS